MSLPERVCLALDVVVIAVHCVPSSAPPLTPKKRIRHLSLGKKAAMGRPQKRSQHWRPSRQYFHCFEIRWDGMRRDLPVELIAEDDDVLELLGNGVLLRIPAVPDLGLIE